jgi:hypothetical protein
MIELKNHDVILAAIHAWMLPQMRTNKFPIPLPQRRKISSPLRIPIRLGPLVVRSIHLLNTCSTSTLQPILPADATSELNT